MSDSRQAAMTCGAGCNVVGTAVSQTTTTGFLAAQAVDHTGYATSSTVQNGVLYDPRYTSTTTYPQAVADDMLTAYNAIRAVPADATNPVATSYTRGYVLDSVSPIL